MKFNRITAFALAAATISFTGVAYAEGMNSQHATVTQRDAHGRATQVQVDGQNYAVCTKNVQDGCINPRSAGLHFGNVPLDHWPGQPASQMSGG
ncbi:hypothetical protein [Novosphingobium sp. 9]|uniref:hypothetical protein n=1 Tax=Novosphingobium sp. 9 TaxID=2025349 RepID=UPI0021B6A24E|nr:hypothetical protein [Novosphingobium sp. 9]